MKFFGTVIDSARVRCVKAAAGNLSGAPSRSSVCLPGAGHVHVGDNPVRDFQRLPKRWRCRTSG